MRAILELFVQRLWLENVRGPNIQEGLHEEMKVECQVLSSNVKKNTL